MEAELVADQTIFAERSARLSPIRVKASLVHHQYGELQYFS